MQHLSPRDAYGFLLAHEDAVFVDCRSEAEYFLVGHPLLEPPGREPVRPFHVCWADELNAEVNAHFVQDIERLCPDRSRPVVIICRSGRRSVSAGESLEAAGFERVYNVLEGFEGPLDERFRRGTLGGWRLAGLPWEQL